MPWKALFLIHLEHISPRISEIRALREAIINAWIEHPYMTILFKKYGMDAPYFKENYAYVLFEGFVNAAQGEGRASDGYHTLIDYLKNRDVTLSDLHRFFTLYRQMFQKMMLRHFSGDESLVDETQILLDELCNEALVYYNGSFFFSDQAHKKELQRFREYEKAINKSAIVSKTDTAGNITYVNQSFCRVSGFTEMELVGMPHDIIRHPDVPKDVFQELWATIQAKKTYRGIIKNRRKDGSAYYVDTTIVPILDEENDIVEYLALRYDVTQLMEALKKADEARKAKDEFLANMSHEIRTPLNGIVGFVSVLRKLINDEKAQGYLRVIQSSGETLMGIVNDILDHSKIQSGTFVIHHEPFDPVAEISATVALFSTKAQEKSIRYSAYIDPNLPGCLMGDVSRIKQVLSNFLSNAVKFTFKNGKIKIKVVYENGELSVMVQDSGIGVSEKKQSKIFEAFEQADNSITRNYGGTGLGLSISSKLVSLMGGRIVFQSVEKKGSLFGCTIPLAQCDQPAVKGSKRGDFGVLKVGLLYGAEEKASVFLLEKYLRDFGVGEIYHLPTDKTDVLDAVFCPDRIPEPLSGLNGETTVVLLHPTICIGDERRCGGNYLNEPFLPLEIEAVLDGLLSKRQKGV